MEPQSHTPASGPIQVGSTLLVGPNGDQIGVVVGSMQVAMTLEEAQAFALGILGNVMLAATPTELLKRAAVQREASRATVKP